MSGSGATTLWGTLLRATTWPFSSTASAFTDVVPTSTPTVTGLPDGLHESDTRVMIRHYGRRPPPKESSTDMTGSRPKALVTAAVSGPGLDLLHQLADLVLDSWLDQPSLRIYNAAQLAERAAAEGANIVIVESDVCGADLYEQPILAVCSCRGDPTNVDVAAATAAGVPVLRAPGRNADAVAELAVALLFAATRGVVPADRDVREGEIYRDGKIPYQRYRAWELAGQTVGLVGLGAVGRALRWRLRGLGMDVLAYDPYAPDATSSFDELLAKSDVISVHAPVTEETTGHDQRRRLRQDARRRRLPEHRPGQDPRHRRARGRAGLGQGRARPGWTTSRASTWPRTTR